jgi:hypothetical protein
LLVWIGVKLLAPDPEDGHGDIQTSDKLLAAIKTIIVADLVMSVDNVIAIAGAAQNASVPAPDSCWWCLGLLISHSRSSSGAASWSSSSWSVSP